MSFEIKYDKHGEPLKSKETEIKLAGEAQVTRFEEHTSAEATAVQAPEQIEQQEVEQELEVQAQPEIQQQAAVPKVSASNEVHIRALREKAKLADQLQRERDELKQQLQQQYQQQTQQKSAAPDEDLDINLGNDDIAEGKHLSKIDKKIKKLENLIKQQNQYTAEMTAEARLKAQYPDFDRVVSKENLETLQYAEPELFQVVKQSPDLYGQAVTAYKLIKKLNISQEPVDQFATDRQVIQKNNAKPRPLTSISPQQGSSPMQQANVFANGLTDELREQLRKEMFAARKAM